MIIRIGADGTIVLRQKAPYEPDVNIECKVTSDKLYYIKCSKQVAGVIVQPENVQLPALNSLVSYPEGQVVVKLVNQYNVPTASSFTLSIMFSDDVASKVTLKSFSEVFNNLTVPERADNIK